MLKIHKEERLEEQQKKAKEAKEDEHHLKSLEKHYDRSKDRKEHAVKQFDTLMVGISTAGIGFVTLYIKDMAGSDLWLARCSQVGFVACLFANLFSHIFSRSSNKCAEEIASNNLDLARYGYYPDGITTGEAFEEYKTRKCVKQDRFDLCVKFFNVTAFILLTAATIIFLIFSFVHPPVVSVSGH